MKYQITVERLEDDSYRAYCPAIKDMHATGSSVNAALAHLQQSFVCYLHDPDAEMEIQIKDDHIKMQPDCSIGQEGN